MNFNKLNEAFSAKLNTALAESKLTINESILDDLQAAFDYHINQMNDNARGNELEADAEFAIEDAMNDIFPDEYWEDLVSFNIAAALFECDTVDDVREVANRIIEDIRLNKNLDEACNSSLETDDENDDKETLTEVNESVKDSNQNMTAVDADAVVDPVYKAAVEDDKKAKDNFADVIDDRNKAAKEADMKSMQEATRQDKENAKKNPETDADKARRQDLNQKIIAATQSIKDAKKYKNEIESELPGVTVDTNYPEVRGSNGRVLSKDQNSAGGYRRDTLVGPVQSNHANYKGSDYYKRDIDRYTKRAKEWDANNKNQTIGDVFRKHPEINSVEEAEKYIAANSKNPYTDEIKKAQRDYSSSRRKEKEDARDKHEFSNRYPYKHTYELQSNNDKSTLSKMDLSRYLTKPNGNEQRQFEYSRRNASSKNYRDMKDVIADKKGAESNIEYAQRNLNKLNDRRAAIDAEYQKKLKDLDWDKYYYKNSISHSKQTIDSADKNKQAILDRMRNKNKTESLHKRVRVHRPVRK